jgi:ATP diphosphatase
MPAAAAPSKSDSDVLIHDPEGGMDRLREIMSRLRDKETGCPWDIVQTFETIAPYTIEEAYEVADAIHRGEMADLEGELGDLLLQVVYHAQMAEEDGAFTFDDVTRAISDKMVRRHPHVFGDESREKTPERQTRDWEEIKAAERSARGEVRESALDGVASALPGLTRAVKLQNRAARVGFDWPHRVDVLEKLVEETQELSAEIEAGDLDAIEDEFGDLLFVMANLARHLKIDPEAALRRTNAKFERRFRAIEDRLALKGRTPAESDLEEMDALWDEAKHAEKIAAKG